MNEAATKLDTLLQDPQLSALQKNLVKGYRDSLRASEINTTEDGKKTAAFWGVTFMQDKWKKRFKQAWLFSFVMTVVVGVAFGALLLSKPISVGAFFSNLVPLVGVAFAILYILMFLISFLNTGEDVNQDWGIRDSDDFMETYIRHGNLFSDFGGFYSKAYYDQLAGRMIVDKNGIKGIVLLPWRRIENIATTDSRVLVTKKTWLPFLAESFGARSIYLKFRNPEETAQFIEVVRQYLPLQAK